MNRKTILIAAGVLLAILFAGAGLLYASGSGDRQAAQVAAHNKESLLRLHSPSIGAADAPVHIVEFFDPACGTCAAFYPIVKKMMAANPQDIRLSLRYAPFHAGSQEVVKALEASRKQGKFWQALEALLGNQDGWTQNHTAHVELIWPYLAAAGVDTDKVKADMQSPDVARVIAQDMQDANTLEVTATPEYFVNGRPLPSFGREQLVQLVQDELAKARRAR
jgi:protein-disulfide isomerase